MTKGPVGKSKTSLKEQPSEPSREELSEFAYLPSEFEDNRIDPDKPYCSGNYKYMKGLLMQRVGPNRYVHSISVAKTARKIARIYGYDDRQARMAGLLHDWDKALSPSRLADRVSDCQIAVEEGAVERMPWILHGPTAAAVLSRQFPWLGEDVCRAIERHTVGALGMTPLDMIIFVADKIEPTHDVAAYKRLYKALGQMSLEELFFAVLKEGMAYLVRADRPISHGSLDVWNWYSEAFRSREIKENDK